MVILEPTLVTASARAVEAGLDHECCGLGLIEPQDQLSGADSVLTSWGDRDWQDVIDIPAFTRTFEMLSGNSH